MTSLLVSDIVHLPPSTGLMSYCRTINQQDVRMPCAFETCGKVSIRRQLVKATCTAYTIMAR